MAILVVNAGSSSLKFALHEVRAGRVEPSLFSGNIEGLEPGGVPQMKWSLAGHSRLRRLGASSDPFGQALTALRTLLTAGDVLPPIEAVAHRVVHGGQAFQGSVQVTDAVLAQLEALASLAPLHQPHNLEGIRLFRDAFPDLPQVACFDTAFHATLPDEESAFALPQAIAAQGVRRYGFHGLSYEHVMDTLRECSSRSQGRVLMAHLGNGASLCAARNGRSCATTMGFSALDGLMMGTRSGALDAGVLLHLMAQGWDHDRLQTLLYRQSGLLGVSGISADMRQLRADDGPAARRAIQLFTHRVVREAGALAACLGGLDVLTFSGGIGEHDAELRAQVSERLAYLGVRLDAACNLQASGDAVRAIHASDSAIEIWVVPADEGRVAARSAAALLNPVLTAKPDGPTCQSA